MIIFNELHIFLLVYADWEMWMGSYSKLLSLHIVIFAHISAIDSDRSSSQMTLGKFPL